MSLDGAKYEQEKGKKKLHDLEGQVTTEKIALEQEKKEKIRKIEETNEELTHLKDALEHHQIDEKTLQKVQNISQDNEIDTSEMKEILKMIDDLHDNESQNRYIPEDLRINKEEYLLALKDDFQRDQTLLKLDSALGVLIDHISPASNRGINLIGGLTLLLDKNLIIVQENHIDIKRSLSSQVSETPFSISHFLKNLFKG